MKYRKAGNLDFYNANVYADLIKRLDELKPNSQRHWGKMDVSQMLHHLNVAIGGALGYYNLPDQSNFISRNVLQFAVINILKKLPVDSKTPPAFIVEEAFDFEIEKEKLKEILEKAFHTKTDNEWGRHTYFGNMTREEWGKLVVIHCNHHFLQFGG